jgi:hypothetical protein
MERLRLAIEVQTGERTTFFELDFNTGRGAVNIGDAVELISFHGNMETVHFTIGPGNWHTAHFDNPFARLVRVSNHRNPNKRVNGQHSMRWAGRSATDRWEEPLHQKEVEHRAEAQGLSVEDYLNT